MPRNTTTANIFNELVIAPRMGQTQEQEQNTANETPSSPTQDSAGKRKSDSLTPPPAPKRSKLQLPPRERRKIAFKLNFCKDSTEETVGMNNNGSTGNTFTPESSAFFQAVVMERIKAEQQSLLQGKKVKAKLLGDNKTDNASQKVEPAKANTKEKNQKRSSETHKTLRRL